MSNKRVELLAPAGNLVCLHAAVRAGADAVYLGIDRFNARRGADNFTLESLGEACDYAHLRGVRVYLTMNTVILPSEAEEALEVVRQAYRCGVDAFIVQDIGLAAAVKRALPEATLHISTQMNTISEAGIEAAANLGASRVTLGRELSLTEIAHLSQAAARHDMEVETFAHGALCICYSGQCFASSLIGGRSANRGMCAQACRLPYELHNRALKKNLPAPGEHLLSPKDLCSVDLLPELVAAGTSSLKLEGRMKSPDYVYAVTGVYRAVLDRVLAWQESDPDATEVPQQIRATDEEQRVLSEAFSRGFTTAYLENESGNEIMSYGRPNNRGVFVGRVSGLRNGEVAIAAETPLEIGDVVEFWTNKGHFAHVLSDARIAHDNTVYTRVPKAVGKGDRVFRVRQASAAFVDDAFAPKIGVAGTVVLNIGRPARLILSTVDGTSVDVEGPIVEAARTKALSDEEIRQHIDRFGGTPLQLDSLDIQADQGVGMGFSTLHKLRSAAAEKLIDAMLSSTKRRLPRTADVSDAPAIRAQAATVVAWATNPACARAAKKAGADVIYIPAINYKRGEACVGGQLSETVAQAGYPNKAVIALPTIAHDPIEGTREARFSFDAFDYVKAGKPVYADSLGACLRAHREGALVEVGPHVPAVNSFALRYLAEAGAQRVWLSPELNLGQIQKMGESTPVELGITVYGANELMVTEHCLLQSQGPCNQDCTTCARRKSPHYLKDRKDYEMPVITDCCGRSHLYNAVSLDIVHLMPDLISSGVSSFMVDTTLLNVAETTDAVARAVRARNTAVKTGDALKKTTGTTTGHLFRGVS